MSAAAAASAMANTNSENVHYSPSNGSNGSTSNINSYHLHQHHFYTNPHNRSDLTLYKVSAIQTALDDNKSPTFAESFESKLLLAAVPVAASLSSNSNSKSCFSSGAPVSVGAATGGSSSGASDLTVNGAGSGAMVAGSISVSGSNYSRVFSLNSSTSNSLCRPRSSTPSIMLTGPDSQRSQTAAASDSEPIFGLTATSSASDAKEPFILTTGGGASSSGTSAELDYALLGRYGWAVLVLTWMIVLVGIASMLGLWDAPSMSKPSAKAYEKATGYPIQGYYSCLVFMVFIASWVWCTTSWVGMKFFRHTKGGLTKSREASTVAT
jgi:hypothetical protein